MLGTTAHPLVQRHHPLPTQGLGPALGSRGLPTTVLFDADGTRVDAHFGLLNAAALQARLARWPPPGR